MNPNELGLIFSMFTAGIAMFLYADNRAEQRHQTKHLEASRKEAHADLAFQVIKLALEKPKPRRSAE